MKNTTAFINGHIITMDKNKSICNSMIISENVIAAIGNNLDLSYLTENTPNSHDLPNIVDLKGKTLIPGLIDSHMHLLGFGITLDQCDLFNTKSISEIIETVGEFMDCHHDKKLIMARGWNNDKFEDNRMPTKYDLDKISSHIPILLTRACGHICVCNSIALELANIDNNTLISGGSIEKDGLGNVNGILKEKAIDLLSSIIPKQTNRTIKKAISLASQEANRWGITSVQSDDLAPLSMDETQLVLDALTELSNDKELTVRIYEQTLFRSKENFQRQIDLGYKMGKGNDFFRYGPLKILGDGSLGGRTAKLKKTYSDDATTDGLLVYSKEDLRDFMKISYDNNIDVAIHCIGDKTSEISLELFDEFKDVRKRNNSRDTIIHCQITDASILSKMKDLNVSAHVQPIFLDYDMHILEDRVGKELASTSYAWNTMINLGIKLGFGSDCPVEHLNPFKSIFCAVTRKDLSLYPSEGFYPSERINVYQALKAFTIDAAYLSREEDIKGSLEVGKLADFAILNENILEVDPHKIKDITISQTFLGGNLVYNNK